MTAETSYGKMREDFLVTPISGKAFPVYKGEVWRIVQEEGGQCVDVNVWNLHDRREFMDTSIMRRQGFHLPKGGFFISNSPRNRLLMQIIEMSPENAADVILHRCSPALLEAIWDVFPHSSCQDSIAEAIREYGLTPDDTHAVLCPWTPTEWDEQGHIRIAGYESRLDTEGDVMDMLALEDVLTAACICGVTDYTNLGNYFPRPLRLQVFEASPQTEAMVEDVRRKYPPLKGQLTPKDYKITRGEDRDFDIQTAPDPTYEPQFINWPQKVEIVECELPADVYAEVKKLVESGAREDDEDAVRRGVMEWYLKNRTAQHPLFGMLTP